MKRKRHHRDGCGVTTRLESSWEHVTCLACIKRKHNAPAFLVGDKLPQPCPVCGRDITLRVSQYGPYWACVGWPRCDQLVGAHKKSALPLGTVADKQTRQARHQTHLLFDQLWRRKHMSRGCAYRWMASCLHLTSERAHIAMMQLGELRMLYRFTLDKLMEIKSREIDAALHLHAARWCVERYGKPSRYCTQALARRD